MLYRVLQLYKALNPKINREEYAWAKTILSSREMALFKKQPIADQRHALDVALDIQRQAQAIIKEYGEPALSELLHASLLHDCGKSLIPPRLWQRIFIVISGYLPLTPSNNKFRPKNIFSKTLLIYGRHPVWGKHLAAKAGTPPEVLTLIERHHCPLTSVEKILRDADSRH